MADAVQMRFEGPVARITLHRPPLNVLTTSMMTALATSLDEAARRDEIRLVRLDAEGKVFCAGVDVGEHLGDRLTPMMNSLLGLFEAFALVPQPIVAVVHGPALGGGCELVLGCDLCLAAERASFGQPEIRLGVFAPPASVLLPRIVGERRALAMLLTGESVTSAEAERIGLVNRVFPDDGFEAEVEAWFERLLELPGAALRQAKCAVTEARERSVP
jgi:cyclohexa-1,5-dienecarbonyl-CoA hydratase